MKAVEKDVIDHRIPCPGRKADVCPCLVGESCQSVIALKSEPESLTILRPDIRHTVARFAAPAGDTISYDRAGHLSRQFGVPLCQETRVDIPINSRDVHGPAQGTSIG